MANITLSPEIRDIIANSTITGKKLALPPDQLDRKIYLSVKKALEMLGAKWNTQAQGFLFQKDAAPLVAEALGTNVVVDERKLFQAFFTPEQLALEVAEAADVEGHLVLEPEAGEGALANACMQLGASCVDCAELHPERAEKLRKLNYKVSFPLVT